MTVTIAAWPSLSAEMLLSAKLAVAWSVLPWTVMATPDGAITPGSMATAVTIPSTGETSVMPLASKSPGCTA